MESLLKYILIRDEILIEIVFRVGRTSWNEKNKDDCLASPI